MKTIENDDCTRMVGLIIIKIGSELTKLKETGRLWQGPSGSSLSYMFTSPCANLDHKLILHECSM